MTAASLLMKRIPARMAILIALLIAVAVAGVAIYASLHGAPASGQAMHYEGKQSAIRAVLTACTKMHYEGCN